MKTCPTCNRKFPTKAALAQHRAAEHGNGGRAAPKPRRKAGPRVAGRQQRLTSAVRLAPLSRGFVDCAIRPFHGRSAPITGVPDNYTGRSVVFENTGIYHFNKPADSTLKTLIVAPAFGNNIWFSDNPNPTAMAGAGFTTDGAQHTFTPNTLPLAFSKHRTIALGARVIYTGPPLTAAGFIAAKRIPLEIVRRPTNATATLLADEVPYIRNQRLINLDSQPRVFIGPNLDGIEMVAHHREGEWPFSPCSMPLANPKFSGVIGDVSLFPSSQSLGNYDSSFEALLIRLTNIPQDASFVLQVRHCIEAIPTLADDIGSEDVQQAPLYQSLAQDSPPEDPAALRLVKQLWQSMPTAQRFADAVGQTVQSMTAPALAVGFQRMALRG